MLSGLFRFFFWCTDNCSVVWLSPTSSDSNWKWWENILTQNRAVSIDHNQERKRKLNNKFLKSAAIYWDRSFKRQAKAHQLPIFHQYTYQQGAAVALCLEWLDGCRVKFQESTTIGRKWPWARPWTSNCSKATLGSG